MNQENVSSFQMVICYDKKGEGNMTEGLLGKVGLDGMSGKAFLKRYTTNWDLSVKKPYREGSESLVSQVAGKQRPWARKKLSLLKEWTEFWHTYVKNLVSMREVW